MMFGSKKTWDGLSSEDQKILMDASKVAFSYSTELLVKDQDEDIAKLKEYGIEFVYPDKEEFREALGGALKPFEEEVGEDFIAHIRGL
jgi:TRAP-type C4-dicarboxylate transport system substrate-binding protein